MGSPPTASAIEFGPSVVTGGRPMEETILFCSTNWHPESRVELRRRMRQHESTRSLDAPPRSQASGLADGGAPMRLRPAPDVNRNKAAARAKATTVRLPTLSARARADFCTTVPLLASEQCRSMPICPCFQRIGPVGPPKFGRAWAELCQIGSGVGERCAELRPNLGHAWPNRPIRAMLGQAWSKFGPG